MKTKKKQTNKKEEIINDFTRGKDSLPKQRKIMKMFATIQPEVV